MGADGAAARAEAAGGRSREARAAPRRRSAGVDVGPLCLDLLSSHMRRELLPGEMRIARDSLMEGIYAGALPRQHHRVPRRQDGDRRVSHAIKAFTADGPRSSSSTAACLSRDRRAGRHLAAKLSDLTGLPVATPTSASRPAPFPAALDDLKAAYDYLTSVPVGGAKASARRSPSSPSRRAAR